MIARAGIADHADRLDFEASIRHRLSEPIGTVRFTSDTATMQFMSDDMVGLKHAAIAGLGIVALPG